MRADVIVIGAGISGLACAHELLKRGLKVLILEAQSRVGGRILTWRDSGLQTPFELGAEFIHGAPSATLKSFETFGLSVTITFFIKMENCKILTTFGNDCKKSPGICKKSLARIDRF